jgi:type 1 glutamine amidotransferase
MVVTLISFPGVFAMRRFLALMLVGSGLLFSSEVVGQEKASELKPLKVLLVTGGCCHDYDRQKLILSEGIGARAKVEFTIVQEGGKSTNHKVSIYEKDDWADAYDVVIHNECFSDVKEPAFTERILKPHREGKPAIVIHCAMHCYRDKTDEWFKFIGVTSHRHGSHFAFDAINLQPDNPIMKGFGEKWTTPQGELYHIEKTWDNCKPLAHAYSKETKSDHVCIWTNTYGKGRVFGTTVGHYSTEMQDPVFLNYVTRGLLWSCDKLNDDYLLKADEKFKFSFESKPGDPQPTPAKKP